MWRTCHDNKKLPVDSTVVLHADSEEQCAASCSRKGADNCFLFEFDSNHAADQNHQNCRLFNYQDGNVAKQHSPHHKLCHHNTCSASYSDATSVAGQCPYNLPRCIDADEDGIDGYCTSDRSFMKVELDELDCGVLENDDGMTCYRFSKHGALCDAHVMRNKNNNNPNSSMFDRLRVGAKSSRFPTDRCYTFLIKDFSKNFECSPGKAGNGMRINRRSGKTFSDCQELCLGDPKCVGFDITAGNGSEIDIADNDVEIEQDNDREDLCHKAGYQYDYDARKCLEDNGSEVQVPFESYKCNGSFSGGSERLPYEWDYLTNQCMNGDGEVVDPAELYKNFICEHHHEATWNHQDKKCYSKACRYYQEDSQTDDATRNYCQLRPSDPEVVPELPQMYCMGQSEADCVYTLQNMYERLETHENLRQTGDSTSRVVNELKKLNEWNEMNFDE